MFNIPGVFSYPVAHVIFLYIVRSIQLLLEKPGSVVLVVSSPAPFFLSYSSTRIPTVRIFLTSRHRKLEWHKQSRPEARLLTNPAVYLAWNMFHGGRRGTAGETVFGRGAQGNFWKRPDGTAERRPPPSSSRTDGLPRWEHWYHIIPKKVSYIILPDCIKIVLYSRTAHSGRK